MTLVWRPGFAYDTDASNYIDAVEAADQADTPGIGAMETGVRYAINDFVIGCKNDGVWTAIKNSCILAGAKTLEGSFIDLKSCTKVLANNNFADGTYVGSNYTTGDYNRETGLLGNGSTKYLNSNRNNNTDPQNSKHLAVWRSVAASNNAYLLASGNATGDSALYTGFGNFITYNNSNVSSSQALSAGAFYASSRSSSSSFDVRVNNASSTFTSASQSPRNANISVFADSTGTGGNTNARLAFYSIGESLDLARLDGRVTDLINAFAVAIP